MLLVPLSMVTSAAAVGWDPPGGTPHRLPLLCALLLWGTVPVPDSLGEARGQEARPLERPSLGHPSRTSSSGACPVGAIHMLRCCPKGKGRPGEQSLHEWHQCPHKRHPRAALSLPPRKPVPCHLPCGAGPPWTPDLLGLHLGLPGPHCCGWPAPVQAFVSRSRRQCSGHSPASRVSCVTSWQTPAPRPCPRSALEGPEADEEEGTVAGSGCQLQRELEADLGVVWKLSDRTSGDSLRRMREGRSRGDSRVQA